MDRLAGGTARSAGRAGGAEDGAASARPANGTEGADAKLTDVRERKTRDGAWLRPAFVFRSRSDSGPRGRATSPARGRMDRRRGPLSVRPAKATSRSRRP